jgi:hypothetical protein
MTSPASVVPDVQRYIDEHGRAFEYVHIRNGRKTLVVHFSAFFGKWGDRKEYRDRFQGYFHRLKMLGSAPEHDWLFLCDAYGAFGDGTYYTGERGDFFVERAMTEIIGRVQGEGGYAWDRVGMAGSSMGATAALKFGLTFDVRAIVAIAPHIDLDICAVMQGRDMEVAWICPDGDFAASHNFAFTRQVSNLLAEWHDRRLPGLFVQTCADDSGVYEEQVLPLVERWRGKGGGVWVDTRPIGGHTSDYATRPLMLDALARLLADKPIDVARYQSDPAFAGTLTPPTKSQRVLKAITPAVGWVLGERLRTALKPAVRRRFEGR